MNFYSGREATSIKMRRLEDARLVGDGKSACVAPQFPIVSKCYGQPRAFA
jgi:hypothetical protein